MDDPNDSAAIYAVPEYGLKMKLNHKYPEKKKQDIDASLKTVVQMLPLMLRYCQYYINVKKDGRKPYMDYVKLLSGLQIYGCPIGGIGTGTIGRGYKGEFCRFQLRPGIYEYKTIHENQFFVSIRNENDENIFQSVLSTYEIPKKCCKGWESNLDGSKCHYTALYPRAWTEYDLSDYGVKLICRQISPIIPNNYKDTSLPCAVFVWEITNTSGEMRTVSISFTWSHINRKKKRPNEPINFERYSDDHSFGVSMEQNISGMPCVFTIAKSKQTNDNISENFCKFDIYKNCKSVWQTLLQHGKFMPDDSQGFNKHKCNAMGISGESKLKPGETGVIEFCLVWDMPTVKFRNKTKYYKRFYTRYFGSEVVAGPSIASYALINYRKWESEIFEWQNPIMEDSNLPDWYKSALMNELYYISDGGTVWFDVGEQYSISDPRTMFGIFGYLEGHEYRMYNTYDVHFYASFALAMLWPNLQVSLQYSFKDTIPSEINILRNMLYDGDMVKRKVANCVPHDLGDPDEEPFLLINAYHIHDVNEWRDLNPKFILQVFRDFSLLRQISNRLVNNDRYSSLEYIDDINELNDDLYVRSVYQTCRHKVTVSQRANGISQPYNSKFNNKDKNIYFNGHCKQNENEMAEKFSHFPFTANNILDYFYNNNSPKRPFYRQYSQYSGRSTVSDGAAGSPNKVTNTFSATTYLQDMYPVCRMLLEVMKTWDKDNDGLIENSGFPDQTYDAWVMTGPSAYCGGLWLSALFAMINMAKILGKFDDANEYEILLEKGRKSYETKLWTGEYYQFDSNPQNKHTIMADQLCGLWYLRSCGFHYEVFPKENVDKVLSTIYNNNVKGFYDGKLGVINGYIIPHGNKCGHIDYSAVCSSESWTGITYGLAALMLYEGKFEEAFDMAGSMYKTISETFGINFETPEAFNEYGNYRSIGYMRPLSIWAMQHALNSIQIIPKYK